LSIAALGLIVHAIIDGIALLPAQGGDLAHAVILHRLPVGMAIWWSLRPNLGLPVAIAAFATISVATAASYILGGPMVELAEARSIAYVQAFVSGSLIHVVAFGITHEHDVPIEPVARSRDWGYRVGILLGLFLVFTAPQLSS
jgi:membrane protease YdiL (CAAX protease family)